MSDEPITPWLLEFLIEHPDEVLEIRGTSTATHKRVGRLALITALREGTKGKPNLAAIMLTANLTGPPPCVVCGARDHGHIRFSTYDVGCPAKMTIAGQPLVNGRFPDGTMVERRDGGRFVVVMPLLGGLTRVPLKTQQGPHSVSGAVSQVPNLGPPLLRESAKVTSLDAERGKRTIQEAPNFKVEHEPDKRPRHEETDDALTKSLSHVPRQPKENDD